mmetsp:Transcript_25688/g.64715  ORF Transcript_25688/g.64715 Transcript_25688/m.64715 type:complete len:259 (+) Transcript_25688:172-948(+)
MCEQLPIGPAHMSSTCCDAWPPRLERWTRPLSRLRQPFRNPSNARPSSLPNSSSSRPLARLAARRPRKGKNPIAAAVLLQLRRTDLQLPQVNCVAPLTRSLGKKKPINFRTPSLRRTKTAKAAVATSVTRKPTVRLKAAPTTIAVATMERLKLLVKSLLRPKNTLMLRMPAAGRLGLIVVPKMMAANMKGIIFMLAMLKVSRWDRGLVLPTLKVNSLQPTRTLTLLVMMQLSTGPPALMASCRTKVARTPWLPKPCKL